jgi:hypothetical protein
MRRKQAIEILGGTHRSAASAIGIVKEAVNGWPDPLNPIVRDRVLAALVRVEVMRALELTPMEFRESREAEAAFEHAMTSSPEALRLIGAKAAEHFRKLRPAGAATPLAAA